jgi:colanic acid/amylovoran biosynthesis glycosyltransferase
MIAVMRKFSVIFCVYDTIDGTIGGPMAWAVDLVRFLKSEGIDVTVLILRNGGAEIGPIGRACGRDAVPTVTLDTSKVEFLEDQVEWILARCKAIGPNVLVANLVLPAMYASKFLRASGIKTIAVMHSDPSNDIYYRDVLDQLLSSHSFCPDIVVSVAEFIDRMILQNIDASHFRREVIACGCRPATKTATAPKERLRLVYAGRLAIEQKRIHETTVALVQASQKLGVCGTMCGDGPEREWVQKRLSGNREVTFAGQLSADELNLVLANHHVFVLLSEYEGMSIALTEAMASGLVPICMEGANGVSEIVCHSKNGLLVADRGDGFLAAVESLQNEATWERLSAAAIETVKGAYDHRITFAKWLALLESMAYSSIDQRRIPKKVTLPQLGVSFAGYPRNRPPLNLLFWAWCKRALIASRMAIRPRARLKVIATYFKTPDNAD